MPFQFRLELPDGEPADPPSFATGVPNWRPGDTLVVNPTLQYRVLEVRDSPDDEEPGVMVVERA
jgi:hypothetical protein